MLNDANLGHIHFEKYILKIHFEKYSRAEQRMRQSMLNDANLGHIHFKKYILKNKF